MEDVSMINQLMKQYDEVRKVSTRQGVIILQHVYYIMHISKTITD